MGRKDEIAASFNAIQNAPEPIDRLNLLGRWIGNKMEEIGQAEQRIDKRLEHLAATEQSLKTLFDALRKQVAETHPVLKELAKLRAGALSAVEQVVRSTVPSAPTPSPSAPSPSSAVPPPLPTSAAKALQIESSMEARLAEQIIASERKLRQLSESVEESLVARAGKLDGDLDANVNRINDYLEHRLLNAQRDADAISNRVSDQLRVVEGRVNELARTVDIHAAEAIVRLKNGFDDMVAPIQQRLSTQVSEMETRISMEMSTVEETMKAQLSGFYLHLDQTGVVLRNQLEEIAVDFRRQADTALAAAQHSVRQQIDTIEDDVRMTVRPILQNIEDRRQNADRQSEAILSGMDEAMRIRLADLRRNGEAVIQLVETQLVDKLKLLRPQAQAAIELAQKQAGQQLNMAMENLRKTVDLSEKQLTDRIEDLRPRAAAALQAAKTEITQHITSLEAEANTATGWIEQRLSQRIDDLTYRARKTVSGQVRELDDASEQLRRRENAQGSSDHAGNSVELDIHVENPESQRSNAA